MNSNARTYTALLMLALSCGMDVRPVSAGELVISAVAPEVSVERRDTGRNFIRLPSLEYAFVIDARCRADLLPRSLSLSVADTRVSISADDIPSAAPVELTVRIPANQIAPVAVDKFCVTTDAEAPGSDRLPNAIKIMSVLSAQASLLCASDGQTEMTYASQPIDVTLSCELPVDEEMPSP